MRHLKREILHMNSWNTDDSVCMCLGRRWSRTQILPCNCNFQPLECGRSECEAIYGLGGGGGRGRRIKLTQNLRKMSGENVNDVLNISNSKDKIMNHQWFWVDLCSVFLVFLSVLLMLWEAIFSVFWWRGINGGHSNRNNRKLYMLTVTCSNNMASNM